MDFPRVRLRTLMIAVAVSGLIVFGIVLARRRQTYTRLAQFHRQAAGVSARMERIELESAKRTEHRCAEIAREFAEGDQGPVWAIVQEREEWLRQKEWRRFAEDLAERVRWERETAAKFGALRWYDEDLARKYALAARRPWLAIAPDPPPPRWVRP